MGTNLGIRVKLLHSGLKNHRLMSHRIALEDPTRDPDEEALPHDVALFVFDELDANSDGSISHDELRVGLSAYQARHCSHS